MKPKSAIPGIWKGQTVHAVSLTLLLVFVWALWIYLSEPFPAVFWSAVAFPVLHQIYVWLTWRLEFKNSAISKSIGFTGYLIAFFFLFGGRFVSLIFLAWLDHDSLGLHIYPRVFFTILLILPGIYAMYSVKRYFGMARAAGADHFYPRFREMPLVNQGLFRFTNNGMYIYAFFLFWAIAVGFNSSAALLVTAFSHVYIWVHFYSTEKPDMEYLYAKT
jgi:hypothetical protein